MPNKVPEGHAIGEGLQVGKKVKNPPSSQSPSQPKGPHPDPLDQHALKDSFRDPLEGTTLRDPLIYPPAVMAVTGEKARTAGTPDEEEPKK